MVINPNWIKRRDGKQKRSVVDELPEIKKALNDEDAWNKQQAIDEFSNIKEFDVDNVRTRTICESVRQTYRLARELWEKDNNNTKAHDIMENCASTIAMCKRMDKALKKYKKIYNELIRLSKVEEEEKNV